MKKFILKYTLALSAWFMVLRQIVITAVIITITNVSPLSEPTTAAINILTVIVSLIIVMFYQTARENILPVGDSQKCTLHTYECRKNVWVMLATKWPFIWRRPVGARNHNSNFYHRIESSSKSDLICEYNDELARATEIKKEEQWRTFELYKTPSSKATAESDIDHLMKILKQYMDKDPDIARKYAHLINMNDIFEKNKS